MFQFLTATIQRDSTIGFPMFGDFTIDPPSFITVWGYNIYFYGIIIACGFLAAMAYCTRNGKHYGFTSDDVYDVFLWVIPLGILGARIYYVLFSLDYYLANPSELLSIHSGGLAIYGGIIAGIITMYFVCRHKKASFLAMLDLLICGLFMGQILGRWGNFFNREAFGAETDIFCRMALTAADGTTIYVHPTFLYESLWNLAGLIFLLVFNAKGKRRYDGQNALIYFLWYGIGRTWIEGLRSDSLYIGSTGIRVSQLLSIVLALTALIVLIIQSKRPHPPEALYVNRKKAAVSSTTEPAAAAAEDVSAASDEADSKIPVEAADDAPTINSNNDSTEADSNG